MTGAPGAEHPLAFHPEPSNLAEEPEAAPLKAPGLGGGRRRVPPHIIPVQYDSVGREQRAQEAAQRRALSSSVLRELRDELSDAPQELWGSRGAGGERPHRGDVERTRLEESLLLRLSESRQARAARRRRQRMTSSGGGALAAITHFGASAALWEPPNLEALPAKRRKKVSIGGAEPPIKTHLHLIYIVKSLIDPCKGAPNMAAPSGGRHLAPRVDPT
ncbi:neuroguidin-like [Pezoporus wallicus]|uniref:neuroguidin-like n=1 Tax=Pezoporus wallicus TaxID=35540 RepID=UPI00254BEF8C|nr:neuroguidin-like [Pezoporus wallicus]